MLISIAIPTYKRLPLLKRVVDDVYAQTWHDWELVVSDDEDPSSETWAYLCELAAKDGRIKILKNTRGKHGQIYNVNSAVMACSGDWIKPLFDDDRMKPTCLEDLARVALSSFTIDNGVVLIGCRAERWRNGKKIGEDKNYLKHHLEIIPQADVLLAMCRFDRWNGRTPTHVMIRGDVVRGGGLMVEDNFIKHPIDIRWFGRILEHGALAMIDNVLVCECQGEVESGTSQLSREECLMTEDDRRVYLEIYDRAEKDKRWPSRLAVDSLICGVRGFYHLTKCQLAYAIKYFFLAARSPVGMMMTVRTLLNIRYPGQYPATERVFENE